MTAVPDCAIRYSFSGPYAVPSVSMMHNRRTQDRDSRGPGNVDRRKGFLDMVERLGQGVVTVEVTETDASNDSAEPKTGHSRESTRRRTPRRTPRS